MSTSRISDARKRVLIMACTNCGGKDLVEDKTRGELTCRACGFVLKDRVEDHGPEWRAFTAEERDRRARTGAPMAIARADKGLSTIIGYGTRDASGHTLSGATRTTIYRLRKWQIRSWTHSTKIRNLKEALYEMNRLCSQMGIPQSIKETAAYIYRKTLEKKLIRGRRIDAIVAASIYLSCRIHHKPRQMDEIALEAKVDRRNLGSAIRRILLFIDMKFPLPSATDLLPRISSDLGLRSDTIMRAVSLIDEARVTGLTIGKSPGGIAGAAIYIASILEEDRRTQREIAEAARVTEVTIRNRYKQLVKSLKVDNLDQAR